jgi:hypothetical protein
MDKTETAAQDLPMATLAGDPLPEAIGLCQGAAEAGLPLKLLGGLGIRVLCPDFPPRLRAGQDIDLACLSRRRTKVAAYLEERGCQPDRWFNGLNGDRQMYFTAPSGRPVDVMVDRLAMCHALDFRPGFGRLPVTLDAADLLLSKLQIVELNEKDAHDIVHLLAGLPLSPEGIDTGRFGQVLASDWGWWRTVTGNLAKLPAIVADQPGLIPPQARFDPVAQAKALTETAESAPKSMKWQLRARVGDRVRWYELPEEVAH